MLLSSNINIVSILFYHTENIQFIFIGNKIVLIAFIEALES